MRSKDSTSSTSRDWDRTSASGRNKLRTGSSHRRPDWNRSSSGRCQPLTMGKKNNNNTFKNIFNVLKTETVFLTCYYQEDAS